MPVSIDEVIADIDEALGGDEGTGQPMSDDRVGRSVIEDGNIRTSGIFTIRVVSDSDIGGE